MHNNIQALQTINEARKSDLADRYMNNICVKFLMKCLKPMLAEEVLKFFMRDEASLYELQTQWYIIEAGKSFLKQRNFEAGLRHLNFISKQFTDMLSNEYDFHSYCLRKSTYREYVELINFNDNIYQDKIYMEAAANVIKYLFEYVHKLKADEEMKKNEEMKKSEDKEEEKTKKKKKKKQEVEEVLTAIQTFRKKIDYYGKEYAETIKNNPFDEAFIYAKNVVSAKYVNKDNHQENKHFGRAFIQAINTFIHFNKPLMVLRALKKLLRTNHNHYD
eukprot:GHVR01099529.1.p1 GENE.GHVR01099529.1~~GHVR01099529.1.p1  ORF type:complete len:275 (-),score=25.64 GHVR01099529.1:669-1493(-)